MEDPTLGVKLNNKFEFESELLDIDFYVSGRAIFKDKDVDIENPVGDLVDLHVTVLDKDNKAYEDYEAYAIENIGAKDVAQVTALKLKFTYMGHELDMSKCDVKAEINAKEVFFTDIIGSVPDDIYYTSTNHPMATPNEDILPLAKALTVAQSTTTEIGDLPVVYTSDASEVSTLTVDVKGNSMAIASYAMEDYKFKVAYYTTVSELVKLKNNTPSFKYNGEKIEGGHDYIEFADRRDDKNQYYDYYTLYNPDNPLEKGSSELVFIPLELRSGTAGAHASTYEFMRQDKHIMLYKTVEYNFSEFYTLMSVNKLANSQNYGNPDIYTNVGIVDKTSSVGIEEFSGLPYEFNNILEGTVLDYDAVKKSGSYNVGLMFSDNMQSASRLYIEKGSTVLLLYPPVEKELADDVTLIDYDISDGVTSKDGDKMYMRTDDRGINSFYSKTWNGNDKINYGKFMFAEGWAWYRNDKSEKMVTSLSNTDSYWLSSSNMITKVLNNNSLYYINENVLNFNIDQMYQHSDWTTPKAYLYDMVTGVDVSDGDFVPIFDSAISAPNLFSSENDFAPKTMVMNDLVAWYKFDDIGDNTWVDSYGGGTDNVDLLTAPKRGINNENKSLKLASGDYILLPEHFNGNEWGNYGFTLEISFGDVNFSQALNYATILMNSGFATDKTLSKTFNLYVDMRENVDTFGCLMINSIADVGNIKIASNAEELLRDSTLSITFDPDDSDMLRIYVDGVEIFNIVATGSMKNFGDNNKLQLGTWAADREISLEIKEIRMYEEDLRETGVVQNAKYDGHYAPTISSGLVAEYDADIAYKNENGENQKPASWATVVNANPITFGEDVNYYFNGRGCVITGTGTELGRVTIPSDVISKITKDFTLEIEFGNVKNISGKTSFIGNGSFMDDANATGNNEFNIFNHQDANPSNFSFYVNLDGRYASFGLNTGDYNKLGYDVSPDTVSYSTLSFVYSETNQEIYVYLNGVQVAYSTRMFKEDGKDCCIDLDKLFIGPDKEGSVIEYRTIRIYNKALSQYEVVQNSKHDGTYNAGQMKYTGANLNYNSFGSMGKTVVGGREIEFSCSGETYILTSINVNSFNTDNGTIKNYGSFIYKDSGDLDVTTYYGNQNLQGFSNFNWPLDQTKTYNPGKDMPFHDFRFGDNATISPGKYAYTGFGNRTHTTNDGDEALNYRLLRTRDEVNHNAYFGMKYKVDFTLSKDYVGPLEYVFQGDDDLWVFLKKTGDPNDTGKLAVDIGGIHASMGQVVDLWNYIENGDSRYARDEDQNYTLYVFLLERGAVASTCYMEFTLPSISSLTEGTPTGSLQFAKQVENIETDDEFVFRLDLQYPIGISESVVEYTVYNENGTADSNKKNVEFDINYPIVSLKSGQMVRFDMIPIGTKYTLTETPNIYYHTSVRKNTDRVVEGNVVEGEITENTDIIIFYNTAGVELPSTGESGVVAYFIPFIVATAWMFTMPYMDKTNKWRAKGRKREE